MRIRVHGVQPDELDVYRKAERDFGFSFEFREGPLTAEAAKELQGFEAVIFLTNSRITEEVAELLAEKGVKYLAARSAGTDHVDPEAVRRNGLRLCSVPYYAPEAISEHTVMLALMILRKIKRIFARVKAGDYTMPGLRGRQLGEMTAGVFGSGRIGRTTMQILKGFGCRILCYDPFQNEEAKKLCTYVTKEELLQDSDIVFLHCPLTPENEGLIGPESLKLMKDGACLVNTARGGLVDAEAVLMALKEGKLSAFAFDVVEGEAAFVRKKKAFDEIDDPVFEELLAMENVVYTPHVAFYTDGAIRSMNEVTLRNLKEFEDTGTCRNEVK